MDRPDFARFAWSLLDESDQTAALPIAACFAREDELIAAVGAGESPPLLRLWRHPRALVLGYQDTRLPAWEAAAAAFAAEGYTVGVRNSGGQAVPLDLGVLNISLIYPDLARNVDGGFAAMHQLLATALAPLPVTRGKVAGGYCPGESDLAVHGRKIAGVAQRWRRGAGSVGAFLLVEGTGAARADVAARFYALAGGVPGQPGHVQVTLDVMAGLNECRDLGLPPLTPEAIGPRLWAALPRAFGS